MCWPVCGEFWNSYFDPPIKEPYLLKFDALGLPELLLQGIRDAKFERCTPVQEETLPEVLAGKNIAAQSQTGTGKTAAFLIGLFHRLLNNPKKNRDTDGRQGRPQGCPRALIIAPTRELADQIGKEAYVLSFHCDLEIATVYGGVSYEKQERALYKCDVLIGTPGRLIDYFKSRKLNFRHIETLVIDEADRMFDMGFIPDLRYLARHLPHMDNRQTQLYSATLGPRIMRLAYDFMDNPVEIAIEPDRVTVEEVEEELYHLRPEEKMCALLGILATETPKRALIFANQKQKVERVAFALHHNGFNVAMWTGDLPQNKRMRILEAFREGSIPIVVASDVASRGIHVDQVDLVVNFDLPDEAASYVHRIGRTARAGRTGKAISLAAGTNVYNLAQIEEYLEREITPTPITDDLFLEDRSPRFRWGVMSGMSLDQLAGNKVGEKKSKRSKSKRKRSDNSHADPKAEQTHTQEQAAASEKTPASQSNRRRRSKPRDSQRVAESQVLLTGHKDKEPHKQKPRRKKQKTAAPHVHEEATAAEKHAPSTGKRRSGWFSKMVQRITRR
jgi:ATP-dependent RNA helicase RhlB